MSGILEPEQPRTHGRKSYARRFENEKCPSENIHIPTISMRQVEERGDDQANLQVLPNLNTGHFRRMVGGKTPLRLPDQSEPLCSLRTSQPELPL